MKINPEHKSNFWIETGFNEQGLKGNQNAFNKMILKTGFFSYHPSITNNNENDN